MACLAKDGAGALQVANTLRPSIRYDQKRTFGKGVVLGYQAHGQAKAIDGFGCKIRLYPQPPNPYSNLSDVPVLN